ncbi:hypothetical protein CPter91_1937 [Collimonas pratensis]|uniref:Uncharacterized protein n=2 Tax=Collimonas pratensis TaxID=279113 RepID=A0A127Q2N3_9BURK|nr:hypothetical protein CPter91_1937 [Collimonas pratensis]
MAAQGSSPPGNPMAEIQDVASLNGPGPDTTFRLLQKACAQNASPAGEVRQAAAHLSGWSGQLAA